MRPSKSTVSPDVTLPRDANRLIERVCCAGEPEGELDALADAGRLADALPDGHAVGLGLPEGLPLGLCDGPHDGLPLGDDEGLLDADADGDADALGLPLADALPDGLALASHTGRSGKSSHSSGSWA